MAVDGAAGTLGRSAAFLTSSKCPSPSCRGQGCQETAKDGGCLMRTEEEAGKGLPWPLHGSGTFLTWSCRVLAAGEIAEGGRVGPGGPTPPPGVRAEPSSWGAGPGDRAGSLGKSALWGKAYPHSLSPQSFVSSCGPWPLLPQAGRELCPRGGTTLSQVRSLQPVLRPGRQPVEGSISLR